MTSGTVDIPTTVQHEGLQHPDLRRGLEGRAEQGDVDPLVDRETCLPGGLTGDVSKLCIVRRTHVGELRTERAPPLTHQGIRALEVEVVRDHHDGAGRDRRVERPGGVGGDHDLGAEETGQPHRRHHLFWDDSPDKGGNGR